MAKESIKCSKCDEIASHDETNNPNEIAEQTGFCLTGLDEWLCPICLDDHFKAEGC